ncbi:MAG: hypothetical protein ABI740_11160, partial [Alphaproteobacteria bacterium]
MFGKLKHGLRAAVAAGLLMLAGAPAFAAPPSAPSLKPSPTRTSTWLAGPEFRDLSKALDAAENNRWVDVRSVLARISDPGARGLLRWRMSIDGNSGMSFADLSKALEDFRGWPDYDKISTQAEITIMTSTLSASDRIAWFTAHPPGTGDGVLALADAYNSNARTDDMNRVIRTAYRSWQMTPDIARTMESRYSSAISADDVWARADMLLWRDNISAAQAMLPRLSSDQRAVLDARIGLTKNIKKVDPLVQAVPAELQDDPGLLLERARWRERRGQEDGELELLVRIKGS